jgi:hypothetical protein
MAASNILIVSIFDEQSSAERAIEDLHNVGIPSDRISYAGGNAPANEGGGLLDSIKSLFYERTSNDVFSDLNNMGVPQEEAHYYAQQYEAGRSIVAVQPDNLSQDAVTILHSNGGYGYRGDWNRASSEKFTETASATTESDSAQMPQSVNQQAAPMDDQTGTRRDAMASPVGNVSGSEASTPNQDADTPMFTSQRRYADAMSAGNATNQDVNNPDYSNQQPATNVNTQGATTSNSADQQTYVNPNQQSVSTPGQPVYTDPNQQNINTPNQQSYVDPNRSSMSNPSPPAQQADADPNRSSMNNPSAPAQQASTDPNRSGMNDPNQQAYTDPNRPAMSNPNQQAYVDPSQQSVNNPNASSQQAYNNPSQQGVNNPSAPGQQAYADPNQQGINNPNPPSQQAYTDPAMYNQGMNNPDYVNRQTGTDPTQSRSTDNPSVNAPQNQSDNPDVYRMRTEHTKGSSDADQDSERDQRDTNNHNPL